MALLRSVRRDGYRLGEPGGTWYYLTESGQMAIGWVKDGGSWYFCHPSGAKATGRVVIGGTAYTFDGSGRWVA